MYPKEIFLGMDLYQIFIMVGMLAALFSADRMAVKAGFSVRLQRHLILSAVLAVAVGFFGAILFQGIYDYIETGTFSLQSGMTFYGGLIFGAGAFLLSWFFLSKPFKLDKEARARFSDMASIAAVVVPLAHGFGRFGCLFAGCCHGKETDAWYGVTHYDLTLSGELIEAGKFVPVQLFEAVFLLALAGALAYLYFRMARKEKPMKKFPLLPVYMVVYGIWRFFIEYARGDDRGQTIVSFLTPSQLVAVILVAGGIAYFCVWYFVFRKRKTTEEAGTAESVNDNNDIIEREEIGNGKNGSNAGV